jgi:precorrin-6B methylase 2
VAASVPERVRWAVGVLAPQPGERVLDIGSGTGASVEAVLEAMRAMRATDGAGSASTTDAAGRPWIAAIDRSATAVERIRERVADAVASGAVLAERTSEPA